MRKLIALFVCLMFATTLFVAAGCAKKEETAAPTTETAPAAPAPETAAPASPEAAAPASPAAPAK